MRSRLLAFAAALSVFLLAGCASAEKNQHRRSAKSTDIARVEMGPKMLAMHSMEKSVDVDLATERVISHLLSQRASDFLAIDSIVRIQSHYRLEVWHLVCGVPQTVDGQRVNYRLTALKKQAQAGMLDDYCCGLIKEGPGEMTILEFELGSTDSPIFEWLHKYRIPAEILQ